MVHGGMHSHHITSFQFLYFPLSCILKDGLGERTRLKFFFGSLLISFIFAEDFPLVDMQNYLGLQSLSKACSNFHYLPHRNRNTSHRSYSRQWRVTNDDPPDDKALLEYKFV